MPEFRLSELATRLGIELDGDGDVLISGLATLQDAGPQDLAFLANPAYARYLATTRAGAVILHPAQRDQCPRSKLVSENPYLSYAHATHLFPRQPMKSVGVHPSAVISESAVLADDVCVGPHTVIEDEVEIGRGSRIGGHCHIGAGSQLGSRVQLFPRVTIYDHCRLGDEVIVHSGAVIGADGFGFAPGHSGFVKIEQLGAVLVGDRVEIGANTTIDRGALGDTVVEEGVKLDNQIQIAHNVRIGAHTVIAACAGISGSTRIGSRCMIGGGVGVAGHLEIADGVHLTGMTLVTHDLKQSGVYSSGTAVEPNRLWRKNVARFRKLDEWVRRIQRLEKKVEE